MSTRQKTRKSFLRTAGIFLPLFALLSLSFSAAFGGGTVSADPPNTVLATVKYCKSKIPNNLDKLCTEGNMNKLRAAYKDDCKGKNQDACIENKAEGGVNQIAGKNPKNAADFNDALNAVIKGAGGGGGGGSPGGGSPGGGSVPTTITTSPISTSGLPTVDGSTQTVKNVLRIAFGIIGAFALLSITASGLKYITSAGNEQRTSEAKNGIVYSLVGLLIAISAQAIISFVVKQT